MSRHLLAFLLSELSTVRLLCRQAGCGGVIETPLERLTAPHFNQPKCPVCNAVMVNAVPDNNPLLLLERAARAAQAHQASLDIEFVIPSGD